ncbi:MAG: MarR family transcriptional regulator [Thermoguttaceae bacterium]|nr:MarR family transcriptional regulator [Thermoguttaceae bacterium]
MDQTSDNTTSTSDNTAFASDNSGEISDKPPKTSDKPISVSDKSEQTSDKILAFIRERESVSTAEVAMKLSLSPSRCRAILSSMVNQGMLIAVGNNKNRRYKIHP